MEKNIIVICSLSALLLLLILIWIRDQFVKGNLRHKIRLLENCSMLYPDGERISLDYRIIEEKHKKFLKNLRNKEDISKFEKKVISFVLDDISNIKSYDKLRRYMRMSQSEIYPFLHTVHSAVIGQYGYEIKELFQAEEKSVISNKDQQPVHVAKFLEELSSAYFRNQNFLAEIRKNMEDFQEQLMEVGEYSRTSISSILKVVHTEDLEDYIKKERDRQG